jgi:competence protein ComEC
LGAGRLNLNTPATEANVNKLKISFLDVGQGDSILITTPSRKKILIDGGESSEKLLQVLAPEIGFFNRHLDYVILTHPHADHVKGLNGLFGRFDINEAVGTFAKHTSSAYDFWLNNLASRQTKEITARAPEELDFGDGVKFIILSPTEEFLSQAKNLNNGSIVGLLVYGKTKFLLTGDAETEVEKDLLRRGVDLNAQVLKVAHHGSSGATSQEFLTAVGPQIAVISVGRDNDFGHPHTRTLNRLERAGARILRTDEEGTISLFSDGQTLEAPK